MQENTARQTQQKDKYELALDEKKIVLQKCQDERNIDSCMKCEKIFDCTTRNIYVDAVYSSMNKGEGGGFEF